MRRRLPLRALAGLLFLAAWAPGPASAARVFLLAIGNNAGDLDEEELRYAERDVTRLAAVMGQLGGVRAVDSVTVLGQGAEAVRGALLETNARIRAAGKDVVLLVYYSGHADAESLHLSGTRLPLAELRQFVAGSPATVRVLALDACRSGAVTRAKGVQAAESFEIGIEDKLAVEGMAIVTSSADDEDSHESDKLRGSFFSRHLVSGLRGAADRNNDDKVTLDEAYEYTYHQTLKSSGSTSRLQHPTYRYDLEGRGGLVLTRLVAASGGMRAARLRIPGPGRYMVMERRSGGSVVAEVHARESGARLALPPGRYFVQRRGRRSLREYRFNLAAGGQADLGKLPYETVAYARLVRKGGAQGASHGVVALASARGAVLAGEGTTPHASLHYAVDFPFLSLGFRLRGGQADIVASDGVGRSSRRELAVGLSAERVFDLRWMSVGLGLLVEGVRHDQEFDSDGQSSTRAGWGAGFGGLLSLQRALWNGLDLRVEGGPMTQVMNVARVQAGAPVGQEVQTPLTWRAGVGLRWSFR